MPAARAAASSAAVSVFGFRTVSWPGPARPHPGVGASVQPVDVGYRPEVSAAPACDLPGRDQHSRPGPARNAPRPSLAERGAVAGRPSPCGPSAGPRSPPSMSGVAEVVLGHGGQYRVIEGRGPARWPRRSRCEPAAADPGSSRRHRGSAKPDLAPAAPLHRERLRERRQRVGCTTRTEGAAWPVAPRSLHRSPHRARGCSRRGLCLCNCCLVTVGVCSR